MLQVRGDLVPIFLLWPEKLLEKTYLITLFIHIWLFLLLERWYKNWERQKSLDLFADRPSLSRYRIFSTKKLFKCVLCMLSFIVLRCQLKLIKFFQCISMNGSLSLPFKSTGKYHMAGNIVICPSSIFKRMMENTAAIFSAVKSSKLVVIPPFPMYLFSGCCKQAGHSPNLNMDGHSKRLLTDTICLRNSLKKFVCNLGLMDCRVIDTCCVTDCNVTSDIDSRIEALKKVTTQDGVHFLATGYDHLVTNIVRTSAGMVNAMPSAAKASKSHF